MASSCEQKEISEKAKEDHEGKGRATEKSGVHKSKEEMTAKDTSAWGQRRAENEATREIERTAYQERGVGVGRAIVIRKVLWDWDGGLQDIRWTAAGDEQRAVVVHVGGAGLPVTPFTQFLEVVLSGTPTPEVLLQAFPHSIELEAVRAL